MTRLARLSKWAALAASAAVVAAPIGYRVGALPLGLAFLFLLGGFLVAAASATILVISIAVARGVSFGHRPVQATLGVVALVSLVPLWTIATARGAPPIHDITTDTRHPPEFVAVVSRHAPDRTVYDGETIASQQREAYPDLAPVILGVPPDAAFDRALAAVREIGWELVATDVDRGRIEATDTTFWFGFKDDVVVRVTPDGAGSRVDVRSLSRVGVGDAGANAKRIRAYVAALTAR